MRFGLSPWQRVAPWGLAGWAQIRWELITLEPQERSVGEKLRGRQGKWPAEGPCERGVTLTSPAGPLTLALVPPGNSGLFAVASGPRGEPGRSSRRCPSGGPRSRATSCSPRCLRRGSFSSSPAGPRGVFLKGASSGKPQLPPLVPCPRCAGTYEHHSHVTNPRKSPS